MTRVKQNEIKRISHVPRFRIGDVKITSRTLCPSLVMSGKSPPNGPAYPMEGLLQTLI